jgi:DNA-binding LacI/PurR family transcriptional regulator
MYNEFDASQRPMPRYLTIYQALKDDLKRHRFADGRLPSEPELDRRFGVSRITLRHAIRLLCQDGLLEKRQGSGTFIREAALAKSGAKPARILCLLSRHINGGWQDPFFAPIVDAIEREAATHPLRVELRRDGPHSPVQVLKAATHGAPPLFLFIGPTAPSLARQLADRGMHLVQIDGTRESMARVHLQDDERAGARIFAAAFRKRPWKRVLFLSGRENTVWRRRLSCLQAELLCLPRAMHFETLWVAGGTDETARGYRAVKQHYSGRPFLHDLVVCVSDRLAQGTLKALDEMGVSCPGEVTVTGYDGLAPRKGERALTTLCVDHDGLGRMAVRLGLRLFEGPADIPVELFLPPVLRIGESV